MKRQTSVRLRLPTGSGAKSSASWLRAVREHSHGLARAIDERSSYRNLLRAVPTGIMVVGADGKIEEANKKAIEMFGQGRRKLIGQMATKAFRKAHLERTHPFTVAGNDGEGNGNVKFYTREGEHREAVVKAVRLKDDKILVHLSDASEVLERKMVQSLVGFHEAINHTTRPEVIARNIVRELKRHTNADAVAFWAHERMGTGDLKLKAFERSENGIAGAPKKIRSMPARKSIAGHVAQTQKPYETFDVQDDEKSYGGAFERHHDFKHYVAVPIIVDRKLYGVIGLWAKKRMAKPRVESLAALTRQAGNTLFSSFFVQNERAKMKKDELTGLPSRKHFEDKLEALRRKKSPHHLFLLDVRQLGILSRWKYSEADRVIQETAGIAKDFKADPIQGIQSRQVHLSRTGGDEIAVIVEGKLTETQVEEIRNHLKSEADVQMNADTTYRKRIGITVDVGHAEFDAKKHANGPNGKKLPLIDDANQDLKRVKRPVFDKWLTHIAQQFIAKTLGNEAMEAIKDKHMWDIVEKKIKQLKKRQQPNQSRAH